MTAADPAEKMRAIERGRLRALVDVDLVAADALHASNFELIHPSGGVWSRKRYLGGIASGDIDYRRFEPTSTIEVVLDTDLAVLRYRSLIDIAVQGQETGPLRCWHLDCYQRDRDGSWRVRWS